MTNADFKLMIYFNTKFLNDQKKSVYRFNPKECILTPFNISDPKSIKAYFSKIDFMEVEASGIITYLD